MTAKSTLYPVFCVHERGEAGWPATTESFTYAHSFDAAAVPTKLSVCTDGGSVVFEIDCGTFGERGDEQAVLLFDPAHHGRKPHNFRRIRWSGRPEAGGAFVYERFGYEYEPEPFPPGSLAEASMADGTLRLRLALPLAAIGVSDASFATARRWIGFNLYRQTAGLSDTDIVKWSGLPHDAVQYEQGLGDLLFARGLDEAAIADAVTAADADSRSLPTRWEKRTYPAELDEWVSRKRHGMSGRIKSEDALRARRNAETTDWGRAMKAEMVAVADYWAARSDNELYEFVPVGNPRALSVAQYFGDPLNDGNNRTLQACLERPYSFYNPRTGVWWRPGMTVRNPGTGEETTIDDDGSGFLAPPGFPHPQVRYMLVGAYRQFLFGMLMGQPYCQVLTDRQACPETSGSRYGNAINNRYGIEAIIRMIFRIKCGSLIPAFGDWYYNNKTPIGEERRRGLAPYSAALEATLDRMEAARPLIGPLLALYSEEELARSRLRAVTHGEGGLNHAFLLLATARDAAEYRSPAAGGALPGPYLLQDSETSILRAGRSAASRKHVVLYGLPSAAHAHGDKLGLWIGAYGYHLLAGVGAYPFTWISPKISAWETHSAACMVVLVDGRNQAASYSRQQGHYEGTLLQAAGIGNELAYPGSRIERWCWLVPAPNGDDAYVVDLNYATGGGTFDYNTAGMLAPERLAFHGLSNDGWEELEGTLRGTMGEAAAPLYEQPGYGWMRTQRRAKTSAPVGWTYRYDDNAALKAHTVPGDGVVPREIVHSLGEMGFQEMGKADWLPFVMWRQSWEAAGAASPETHAAALCAVLEPYAQEPFLAGVYPLRIAASAGDGGTGYRPFGAEIVFADGHVDIVASVYGMDEAPVTFADSRGRLYRTDAKALLLRYRGDTIVHAEALRFTTIDAPGVRQRREAAALRGTVRRVDIAARTIDVELAAAADVAFGRDASEAAFAGRVALIDSPDYAKPSAYYIRDPHLSGRMLQFQTDVTLICMNADSPFAVKKRELAGKSSLLHEGVEVLVDVKPGDSFVLTNAWTEAWAELKMKKEMAE
ncbi:hypothetical protein [Paenibacillus cymbidii]|uniref:hypothetical protein n=1 Tax=Paenibacillus cymbidii TaxID=1639034 RepID=UPI0010819B10|nr:hypothetical protein [Paenibacillus cymbidii]